MTPHPCRTDRWSVFLALLVLALLAPLLALPAAEPTPKPPAATPAPSKELTAEQKTSLKVLDEEITRLSVLLDTIDDAAVKGAVRSLLDGFKDRRHQLRSDFDQMAYDELRLAILTEYQRLLLWLAPPASPPPKSASRR